MPADGARPGIRGRGTSRVAIARRTKKYAAEVAARKCGACLFPKVEGVCAKEGCARYGV